jgi:hypothetical protein
VTSYPAAKGFFGNREQDIFLCRYRVGLYQQPGRYRRLYPRRRVSTTCGMAFLDRSTKEKVEGRADRVSLLMYSSMKAANSLPPAGATSGLEFGRGAGRA